MNGLIKDSAGNLYGTTLENGPLSGTVFELSPSGGGWTQRVIYSAPTSTGLTMDAAGNIYGATTSTVFELSPNGNGGWNPTVIHTFGGYPYDGSGAEGTPVLDQAGNLYGTTYEGGAYNRGTVYKLSPGEHGKWMEEVLYSLRGAKMAPILQRGLCSIRPGTFMERRCWVASTSMELFSSWRPLVAPTTNIRFSGLSTARTESIHLVA
jgi:uncharacterized repeat protein (TIGR03803 family)